MSFGSGVRRWKDFRKSQPPSTTESGFLFVRSNEGDWAEVVKGVKVKDLYTDHERKYSTVLVQMDPGASFPEHRHVKTEECYIISGDLHMGGQVFYAGDYVRAEADSIHEGIYSENGCTLLVAASQENEMIG